MAITNNTNVLAGAWTRMARSRAAYLGATRMPFLAALLNRSEFKDDQTLFDVDSEWIRTIEGVQDEIPFLLEGSDFTAVSSASASTTLSAEDVLEDPTHNLALYNKHVALRKADMDKLTGKSRKHSESLVQMVTRRELNALFNTVNKAFHGTADQTATTIGSWRRAIAEDDTEPGGTYIGMERATMARYRGQVTSAPLTVGAVSDLIAKVRNKGGSPDLALLNIADYNVLREDVRDGQIQVYQAGQGPWESYGKPYFMIDDVKFLMDEHAVAGAFPILDTSTWRVVFGNNGPEVGELKRSETTRAQHWMPIDAYVSIVCGMPKHNGKFIIDDEE